MPQVLSNRRISRDFYLMRVAQPNDARMGQFCMLRAWGRYPLLSRPVSVFDADAETLSFLYRVVGEGTDLLARRREGDAVETGRVLGNTFPLVSGRVALVGGGAGIAPLYLAARTSGHTVRRRPSTSFSVSATRSCWPRSTAPSATGPR